MEKAIDKNIPITPYEDYYMEIDLETGEPVPVSVAYFCPNCLNLLDEDKDRCSCGQLIDWERR